jgi:hypothetical protein
MLPMPVTTTTSPTLRHRPIPASQTALSGTGLNHQLAAVQNRHTQFGADPSEIPSESLRNNLSTRLAATRNDTGKQELIKAEALVMKFADAETATATVKDRTCLNELFRALQALSSGCDELQRKAINALIAATIGSSAAKFDNVIPTERDVKMLRSIVNRLPMGIRQHIFLMIEHTPARTIAFQEVPNMAWRIFAGESSSPQWDAALHQIFGDFPILPFSSSQVRQEVKQMPSTKSGIGPDWDWAEDRLTQWV